MRRVGRIAVLLAIPATIISAAASEARVTAGPGARVSDDRLVRAAGVNGVVHQAEAELAIDPGNARHLLGGAQEARLGSGGARANAFYVSTNGGQTWTRGLVPGIGRLTGGSYQRVSDPMVALGRSGAAYYSSLALNIDHATGGPTDSAVLVNRSPDGGHTWRSPVAVAKSHGAVLLDKEWVAVDGGASSPRAGALYVVWTKIDTGKQPVDYHIFFARSIDGGLTWTTPGVISGGDSSVAGAIVLVRPNGDLAVVYQRFSLKSGQRSVRVVRSQDGGDHWSHPATVTKYSSGSVPDTRAALGLTAAAEPSTGRFEIAWQRAGPHGGGSDVATAGSDDGGRSWTRPVRVLPKGDSTLAFVPSIAVSRKRVGVLLYERLGGSSKRNYLVSYAQSSNGGRSFGHPIAISPRFDAHNASPSDRGRFFGDYAGLVETSSFAQALWVDSRNRPSTSGARGGNDVFTARIATH